MNAKNGSETKGFSQLVKREIVGKELRPICCQTAAAYGVACFSKVFNKTGLLLSVEQQYIAQWAADLFLALGIQGEVRKKHLSNLEDGTTFEFSVHDSFAVDKMLALFGHTGEELALRILDDNFSCQNCRAAFAAAAFLCAGTITDPNKSYSLEFWSPKQGLLQDFCAMLESFGLAPKMTVRKGVHVLYFKASGQIEDMLIYMFAPKSALEIMNLKIYRDFRNKANRITNCETANIDKMLAATKQILQDISLLEEKGVLQNLPEPLQEAASLRQTHPEYSLSELSQIASSDVTKSGLSHRYRKIRDLAENYRKNIKH